jgi:AcrR family transcriptional regulator
MTAPRRRGRPVGGGGGKREEILAAARRVFAAHGFDGATLRTIAADADVDPAMVRHYFGDKAGLFRAALHLPMDPGQAIAGLIAAGGIDGLGERLVRFFLTIWEGPAVTGDAHRSGEGASAEPERRALSSPFVAFLRGAAAHDDSRTMLRDLLDQVVFPTLAKGLAEHAGTPPEEARLRAVLCGSQLVGLGMARYVIQVEPVASLPPDRLAELYGPTLQRYLHGALT